MLGYTEVNVRTSDLMDAISISDMIEHFGTQAVLDEIGADEAKAHFGLVEEE